MNNIFVYNLSTSSVDGTNSSKLCVEDNVGEAIHIHWRDLRIETSVEDFVKLSEEFIAAKKVLEDGDN